MLDVLHVVETEDDRWLGALDITKDGRLRVVTGRRGHPVVLELCEVVSIEPADGHPDVEY
ncbi:MAG: hypothetical protein ACXVYY_01285 [Oryzihumus sp.]